MKTKTEIKLWLVAIVLLIANGLYLTYNIRERKESYKVPHNYFTLPINGNKRFETKVTVFNIIPEQIDGSPCIAKSGYFCERNDVVDCPRNLPHGVKIKDKIYTCLDFTNFKYNDRFNISFDKDIEATKRFGKQRLIVELLN